MCLCVGNYGEEKDAGDSDSVTSTVVIWRQASHKADSVGCRSLLGSVIDG